MGSVRSHSRRHDVIAAVKSRADNSCDCCVKADCQPFTLTSVMDTLTVSQCVSLNYSIAVDCSIDQITALIAIS